MSIMEKKTYKHISASKHIHKTTCRHTHTWTNTFHDCLWLPACTWVSDMQTALPSYIKTCHLEEPKKKLASLPSLFPNMHTCFFVGDKHPQTLFSHQDFFFRLQQVHTEILIACSLAAKIYIIKNSSLVQKLNRCYYMCLKGFRKYCIWTLLFMHAYIIVKHSITLWNS